MTIFCRYCIHRSGTYNIHVEYCTCRKKDGCNSASGANANADTDANAGAGSDSDTGDDTGDDAGDDAGAGANANVCADHIWLCYENFKQEDKTVMYGLLVN